MSTHDDFPPVPEGQGLRRLTDVPLPLRPVVGEWLSRAMLSGVRHAVQEAAFDSYTYGMKEYRRTHPALALKGDVQLAPAGPVADVAWIHAERASPEDERWIPAGLLRRVAFWELIAVNQGVRQAILAAVCDAQRAVSYQRWPHAAPDMVKMVPMPFMGMREVNVVPVPYLAKFVAIASSETTTGSNVIPLFPDRRRQ